jgi:dGTPase
VNLLEKDGQGLNLTYEVRDGMKNHQMSTMPCTLEGAVVRLSDKIAYIHHDMDDAVRAGILREDDVPAEIRSVLGSVPGERLDVLIHDIIMSSTDKDDICMSERVGNAMKAIREFMFKAVYTNPVAKSEESKAEALVETLYYYFLEHEQDMPAEYLELLERGEELPRVVCDYVGSMTDRYAITTYNDLFVPKSWEH